MTKAELKKLIDKHTTCASDFEAIWYAVEKYTDASNGAKPDVSGSLLSQAKELFAKLTNDERIEVSVSSDYCKYCGQNEAEFGKCYCAPCYDE